MTIVREEASVAPVKEQIEVFYKAEGRVPADMAELVAKYPGTPTTTTEGKQFTYLANPPSGYTLTTPGKDGVLGNADDWDLGEDLAGGGTNWKQDKSRGTPATP
jgi:hypothetical protein